MRENQTDLTYCSDIYVIFGSKSKISLVAFYKMSEISSIRTVHKQSALHWAHKKLYVTRYVSLIRLGLKKKQQRLREKTQANAFSDSIREVTTSFFCKDFLSSICNTLFATSETYFNRSSKLNI